MSIKGPALSWALKGTYLSLCILAIGIFTSITFSALSHILLLVCAPPLLYYYYQQKVDQKIPLSTWCLLGIILSSVLSILLNLEDIKKPVTNFLQLKYFIMSFVAIFSYRVLFLKFIQKKHIKILLYLFLLATTLATISGLIGLYSGYNPLRFKAACSTHRACGLYGMYMTYGYGVALFMVLISGLLIHRQKIKSYINLKFLYFVYFINFLGLILSYSRGAIIGFFMAIPFFFLKKHKKLFISLLVIFPILFGISFFSSKKVQNLFLSHSRMSSNMIRISQYQAAWAVFRDHRFFGIGFKNFEPHCRQIKEKLKIEYQQFIGHAHNNFIEHLATTGLFGFVMLLLFHIFWFRESYKRDDFLGNIFLPFIVALFVSGQFQYSMGDGENMFLIMNIYALSQVNKSLLPSGS